MDGIDLARMRRRLHELIVDALFLAHHAHHARVTGACKAKNLDLCHECLLVSARRSRESVEARRPALAMSFENLRAFEALLPQHQARSARRCLECDGDLGLVA